MSIIGKYRHFKGLEYQVYGKCFAKNNLEYVLYKPLYNDSGLWVRPYSMFFEIITKDDRSYNRFTLIEKNEAELNGTNFDAIHSETLDIINVRLMV